MLESNLSNAEVRKLFDPQRIKDVSERYQEQDIRNPLVPFCVQLALDDQLEAERDRLERLFEHYQKCLGQHSNRQEIINDKLGRLWDKADRQHFGAYYELEVLDFLSRAALPFSIEPSLADGNPDFQIDQPTIIVEVATVFDDPKTEKQWKAYRQISHAVNRIEHDRLRISLHIERWPLQVTARQLKQLCESIQAYLSNVDQGIENGDEERKFFIGNGLCVTVLVRVRDAGERGSIVWSEIGFSCWLTPEQSKRAIRGKVRQYKKSLEDLHVGYIVALELQGFQLAEGDIEALLLGDKDHASSKISGVLMVQSSWDRRLGTRSCAYELVHNPNARVPLDPKLFVGKCPQLIITSDGKQERLE